MGKKTVQTIFEKSQAGQKAYSLPKGNVKSFAPPENLLRKSPPLLPEISELDLMRHFTELAGRNVGIDNTFYPLGSCTMKYNPRINELAAAESAFCNSHPLAPVEMVQGNLQVMYELIQLLCQVCGLEAGSLFANAGAQGELAGIKMIQACHAANGEGMRNEVLIPDSAHGTNPATAAMAGYKTVTLKSTATGEVDLEQLRAAAGRQTAALMLTNPSTLGLFSPNVCEITAILHQAGALTYYDGANLNAIMNLAKPGDMGFDVMHINLHKTFSTPHGGGGPGAAAVLCNSKLQPYLPSPQVVFKNGQYAFEEPASSIGSISPFFGNFSIYLRAFLYGKLHGHYGLQKVAENAVLNANYLKKKVGQIFDIPYSQPCMHEFVVQADRFLNKGIKALDIAKRILDYGMYAPTIYFPLIVKEAMLIEPTECESKATLDRFVEILQQIAVEAEQQPELVKTAPHTKPVGRLDEVKAAKQARVCDPNIFNLG